MDADQRRVHVSGRCVCEDFVDIGLWNVWRGVFTGKPYLGCFAEVSDAHMDRASHRSATCGSYKAETSLEELQIVALDSIWSVFFNRYDERSLLWNLCHDLKARGEKG